MASKLYNLNLTEDELHFIHNSAVKTIEKIGNGSLIPLDNNLVKNLGKVKTKTQKLINQINDDHN